MQQYFHEILQRITLVPMPATTIQILLLLNRVQFCLALIFCVVRVFLLIYHQYLTTPVCSLAIKRVFNIF